MFQSQDQQFPEPESYTLCAVDKQLIDWFFYLVSKVKTPLVLSKAASATPDQVCTRLTAICPIRGTPNFLDLSERHHPVVLFDLNSVLFAIMRRLLLKETDAAFPWHDAANGYPQSQDAFAIDWDIREQARLADGTYQPVPWAKDLPPIDGHYVHLSTKDPNQVAFTPSPDKGARDLQTSMRPGRYLTRFYDDLTNEQIRDFAAQIEKAAELKFATTADDIEDIYLRGPNSCMSKDPCDYESPCHPVSVYGDSDLQLAYINGSNGDPVARCLVWPEPKIHGRAYGDTGLIIRLLERAGYKAGSFSGARIRRISAGRVRNIDRVVMPYIDNVGSFGLCDDERFLVIGGEFIATMTDGIAALQEMTCCRHCDESIPAGRACYVDGEDWCEECFDHNSFESDFSNERFPDSASTDVVVAYRNGRRIEENWAECEAQNNTTWCDATDAFYKDDAFEFVTLKNGETWVKHYFDDNGDPDDLADPPIEDAATPALQEAA